MSAHVKATEEKLHLLYLDSLRGLAALLVILHHAYMQFDFVHMKLGPGPKTVLFWFQNGHYSVDFFIVLSGYCLMIPASKNGYTLQGGIAHFFRRRAKRILPPYYLAMLLSLLLIGTLIGTKTGTHWDISIPVTSADIFTHLFLVQDAWVETSHKINHVFWSISVEWRIYFLFPLLLLLWRRWGAMPTVAVSAVISGGGLLALHYLHQAYPSLNDTANGLVPHYLLLFALGMLGADITLPRNSLATRINLGFWWAAVALLTLLLLVAGIFRKLVEVEVPWELTDILVGFWAVCVLTVCSRAEHASGPVMKGLRAVINWPPLVLLGTFGYSLYLVHAPLLQVLWQYVLHPLGLAPFTSFLLLATVGTTIVILLSYAFFLLCEKPFMTRRRAPVAVTAAIEPAI